MSLDQVIGDLGLPRNQNVQTKREGFPSGANNDKAKDKKMLKCRMMIQICLDKRACGNTDENIVWG